MGGEERTVLVVDDDAALRMLCRVNLELEGYRVLEAGTTETAADILVREPVDAVLLDVHVGDDDGLVLLGAIRRAGAKVALLTGTASVTPEQERSVDAVQTKPFTLEALSETVRLLVGR